jgi:LysR family hydrogen peroxide-inducible transcriptional activator
MDLKQLEALVAIADHGSFSAAATALDTVQSNVSGRIARLERELDTELVDRASGRPTASGEIVLSRARRILTESASIATDVTALGRLVQGSVTLGVIGTTGRWLIPRLLGAQRERYPFVALRIVEGTNLTIEPGLLQGKLDLAVLSRPVASGDLNDAELFSEDLVLIVPESHDLARRGSPVPFAVAAALDLLLPLGGTPIRSELDAAAATSGVALRPLLELDGLRTIASLVFDGYGVAILPATALSQHMRERFVALPVLGLPPRHVGLAIRRHGFPSAPVRAMRELLFSLVAEGDSLPQGVHPLVGAETS